MKSSTVCSIEPWLHSPSYVSDKAAAPCFHFLAWKVCLLEIYFPAQAPSLSQWANRERNGRCGVPWSSRYGVGPFVMSGCAVPLSAHVGSRFTGVSLYSILLLGALFFIICTDCYFNSSSEVSSGVLRFPEDHSHTNLSNSQQVSAETRLGWDSCEGGAGLGTSSPPTLTTLPYCCCCDPRCNGASWVPPGAHQATCQGQPPLSRDKTPGGNQGDNKCQSSRVLLSLPSSPSGFSC